MFFAWEGLCTVSSLHKAGYVLCVALIHVLLPALHSQACSPVGRAVSCSRFFGFGCVGGMLGKHCGQHAVVSFGSCMPYCLEYHLGATQDSG
jgi:hypothetical protein